VCIGKIRRDQVMHYKFAGWCYMETLEKRYIASLAQITVSLCIGACTIVGISVLHFYPILDPNLLLK
jgi:hypothetical protein